MSVKGPEPAYVPNPHTTQSYTRPTGPAPSQQMRREDVFSNNRATNNPPPPGYKGGGQTVMRTPNQNNPPPPGARPYNPPPHASRSVAVTVEESTIRPSILRDNTDPLEKYRIKDTNETNTSQTQSSAPKSILHKDDSDPLQRYRVKSAEEEQMTWNIYLFGLVADPDKPVELKCDGNLVYMGDGVNGTVTTRVVYQAQGPTTAVTLSIKSMNFNLTKNLEIGKGRFIKFAIESNQLKFRQQITEID